LVENFNNDLVKVLKYLNLKSILGFVISFMDVGWVGPNFYLRFFK
jgi:hypothetical protein